MASDRQDSIYHGLCYTSRGALAGTRNSSMGPPDEAIRRPIDYICIVNPRQLKFNLHVQPGSAVSLHNGTILKGMLLKLKSSEYFPALTTDTHLLE